MRAIVLAGGYAKRMWPLTEQFAKPLLPLAGKPTVELIALKLLEVNVEEIFVSTNLRFRTQFQSWLESTAFSNIRIVIENSTSEEDKLGAIRALSNLSQQLPEDDYFVVAGDNAFSDSLREMLTLYREKRNPVVAVYNPANPSQLRLGSAVTLDSNGRILEFEEKPTNPSPGAQVGACLYLFPYSTVLMTNEYIEEGLMPDEPGRFISWLCKKEPVYAYKLKGRLWDIGTIEEYERAKRELNFDRGSEANGKK